MQFKQHIFQKREWKEKKETASRHIPHYTSTEAAQPHRRVSRRNTRVNGQLQVNRSDCVNTTSYASVKYLVSRVRTMWEMIGGTGVWIGGCGAGISIQSHTRVVHRPSTRREHSEVVDQTSWSSLPCCTTDRLLLTPAATRFSFAFVFRSSTCRAVFSAEPLAYAMPAAPTTPAARAASTGCSPTHLKASDISQNRCTMEVKQILEGK